MAALSWLDDFAAFQVLVLGSLAGAGLLTFLYLRRLGAERVGAYVGGLSFALGPYAVGHLGDTATVVAAPLLPLVLLAAESHVQRGSGSRAAGLSVAIGLLLLAGSPEAARAGLALAAGRLVVGHLLRTARTPSPALSVMAVLGGVLLAAPQLVPTLLASREAGRAVTDLASTATPLPGLFGVALRYASHTPMPALALAALPLALTQVPVRVLGLALLLSLGLQWGRGPLAAAGALALVFDLTLAVLGGLSLSAQWRERRTALGGRLRAYFLVALLGSLAALSVAAAALGPLPQTLAGPVGVLALSLILYFSLAASPHPLRAGIWLLPLTVAFVLQPYGRLSWQDAPTRSALHRGTGTWEAVDGVVRTVPDGRLLALVRTWPAGAESDLAYANLAGLRGRRSANGYDPLTPLRTRLALGGMSAGGVLPGAFLREGPARLEMLGIRWILLPAPALTRAEAGGDRIDVVLAPGQARTFPLRLVPATGVRIVSSLSEATAVAQGTPVAIVEARLASTGRTFDTVLRAGEHTAEWAWDREDVRPRVAHARAPLAESWPGPGGGFDAHLYVARLDLPGKYWLDAITIRRPPGAGQLLLSRIAAVESSSHTAPVSLASSYVSDPRLVERLATPLVRVYEAPRAAPAWVVEAVRVMPTREAVRTVLSAARRLALDPRLEAVVAAEDAAGTDLSGPGRAGRAEVRRPSAERLDIHAAGPGLLVVAEAWDAGWRAQVDGGSASLLRVNDAVMGVPLGAGTHQVTLRYEPRGLGIGLALCGAGLLGLLAAVLRRPPRQRRRGSSPSGGGSTV